MLCFVVVSSFVFMWFIGFSCYLQCWFCKRDAICDFIIIFICIYISFRQNRMGFECWISHFVTGGITHKLMFDGMDAIFTSVTLSYFFGYLTIETVAKLFSKWFKNRINTYSACLFIRKSLKFFRQWPVTYFPNGNPSKVPFGRALVHSPRTHKSWLQYEYLPLCFWKYKQSLISNLFFSSKLLHFNNNSVLVSIYYYRTIRHYFVTIIPDFWVSFLLLFWKYFIFLIIKQ